MDTAESFMEVFFRKCQHSKILIACFDIGKSQFTTCFVETYLESETDELSGECVTIRKLIL